MKLPRLEIHKIALAASAAVLIPMATYPMIFGWGFFLGLLSLLALLSDARAPRWLARSLVVPSLAASAIVFAAGGLAIISAFGLSPVLAISILFLFLSFLCFVSLIKYLRR